MLHKSDAHVWLVLMDFLTPFCAAFMQHCKCDLFVKYFEQHCAIVRAAYMQHFSMLHCCTFEVLTVL